MDYEFSPDVPEQAEMYALFERAFAENYILNDADKALLVEYLKSYMRDEWERGVSDKCEGSFTTIDLRDFIDEYEDEYEDEDEIEDEDVHEETREYNDDDLAYVMLTQEYAGDHHDANNLIFNWFYDLHGVSFAYGTILEYRRADSMNPQIADIIVKRYTDF